MLRDIGQTSAKTDKTLIQRTEKYLRHLSNIEGRIKRQWQQTHPGEPDRFSPNDYQHRIQQLHDTNVHIAPRTYVSRLDSLQSALHFLRTQKSVSSTDMAILSDATGRVEQLQKHLDMSQDIYQYIGERRQQLTRLLASYSQLPAGLAKDFEQLKTTAYYYRQELEQYKTLINRPRKMEEKALELLNKIPAFGQFMAKYSMLAQLFRLPADYDNPGSLSGLQTRAQVQQLLQQQAGTGGAGGMAVLQEQVAGAQDKLRAMRDNVTKYGAGGQDMDIPGFIPDQQKTKTFLQRLTYVFNLQLARSSTYFPNTGNLGFSVGYKIKDKSTAGVGLSYDLGLGSGWDHIHFSSQGLGLRSFMDWRVKSSYYLAGGFEENYLIAFHNIAQLRNYSTWQGSALVGLEKKYRISQKMQGNIQLLYDILYKRELPPGQMLKFRVGYSF
ncbi:MAG: hypothetical protein BGO55_00100 [Sphingobacteriales bacterium 50-39]|nr:MAG: hypothetical protein BGO55_00100 [Sphingobacteriales bacterium 50-39]